MNDHTKATQFDKMMGNFARRVSDHVSKLLERQRHGGRATIGNVLSQAWDSSDMLRQRLVSAVQAFLNMLVAWTLHIRNAFVQPAANTIHSRVEQTIGPQVRQAHAATSQHFDRACKLVDAHFSPAYQQIDSRFGAATAHMSKLQVAICAAAIALLFFVLWHCFCAWRERSRGTSLMQQVLTTLKSLPFFRTMVKREMDKVVASMREDARKLDSSAPVLKELPQEGVDGTDMLAELNVRAEMDFRFVDGQSKATGSIYMAGDDHRELLNDVYCMFSQSNPLHADMFPSVRRMEAEVVQMAASLLGGGACGNPEVCGSMTSGGSESIITAMFASLAYQRKARGIVKPEILIADSAHAAYYKAASYSGAKLCRVPVSTSSFQLTAANVKHHIARNTAVVVVSAVTYPHGVMDDIAGIAALCKRRGVLLHVDACLGGFVLPFMRNLGYKVAPFDFAVAGVTSMSVDTHKYGMGHKGTSVVLYSSRELRRAQYTSITEWSGGLYISPGLAGSRSGALIATAWAAMRHMGRAGYVAATKQIMDSANQLKECVRSIPELRICGEPAMCNVAFMSADPTFDVLKLNDLLSARKWHYAVLIKPPALHFCFTHQHVDVAHDLCQDLLECCAELRKTGEQSVPGKAKMYGMASSLPDRQGLADLMVAYQDIMLSA